MASLCPLTMSGRPTPPRAGRRRAPFPLLLGIMAACLLPSFYPLLLLAEETMPEAHALDRPEILGVLFHPLKTGRTSPPAGAQDLDLAMADGVMIGCRLFTAAKEAPVLLFFHGNGETVPDYDDLGPLFTGQGINFLAADYRGYGWSGGSPSASALLRDGRAIYQGARKWLHDNGYSGKVLVMGRSLGSVSAIDLAAQFDSEISGLIIDSGFAETIPLAKTLGIDLAALGLTEQDGFNNSAKIERVQSPTLIIHGQRDTLIPLWQAQRLHAACGARVKELQIVPGADHNTLIAVAGNLYFQEIKRFVDRITGANDWRARRKQMKNK